MLEEDYKKINELLSGTAQNQDGTRPNTTIETNNPVPQNYNRESDYQNRHPGGSITMQNMEETKRENNPPSYLNMPPTYATQPNVHINMERNAEEEESYASKHADDTPPAKRGVGRPEGRKSKRGRKRKHREPKDGSTDSDSELFDYDKFIKKVSKKGTRVHVNVRMFAVRTIVEGTKSVLQQNSKMSMGSKGEKVVVPSGQGQPQTKQITNESPAQAPAPPQLARMEEPQARPSMDTPG